MRWLRPGLIVTGCLMLAACRAPKKKAAVLTPLNSGGGLGRGAISERADRSWQNDNHTQLEASASTTKKPDSKTGKSVEQSKEAATSDKPPSPVVAIEKPSQDMGASHEDVVGAESPSRGRKGLSNPVSAEPPLLQTPGDHQTNPKGSAEKTPDSIGRTAAAKDASETSSTAAPHPDPLRADGEREKSRIRAASDRSDPQPVPLEAGREGKPDTLRGSKLFDNSLSVPHGAGGERTPPSQNARQIGQRLEQTRAAPFSPSDGEKVRMRGSVGGIGPAQSLELSPGVSRPATARDAATLPLVAKDASLAPAKSPASSIVLDPADQTRLNGSSIATRHVGADLDTTPKKQDTAASSAKLWDGVTESGHGQRGQLSSAPRPTDSAGKLATTTSPNSTSSRSLPAVSAAQQSPEEPTATPITIDQWLQDRQAEARWRDSQVAQQADEQKAKEEQWKNLRRSFYRFLLGTSGKESE